MWTRLPSGCVVSLDTGDSERGDAAGRSPFLFFAEIVRPPAEFGGDGAAERAEGCLAPWRPRPRGGVVVRGMPVARWFGRQEWGPTELALRSRARGQEGKVGRGRSSQDRGSKQQGSEKGSRLFRDRVFSALDLCRFTVVGKGFALRGTRSEQAEVCDTFQTCSLPPFTTRFGPSPSRRTCGTRPPRSRCARRARQRACWTGPMAPAGSRSPGGCRTCARRRRDDRIKVNNDQLGS